MLFCHPFLSTTAARLVPAPISRQLVTGSLSPQASFYFLEWNLRCVLFFCLYVSILCKQILPPVHPFTSYGCSHGSYLGLLQIKLPQKSFCGCKFAFLLEYLAMEQLGCMGYMQVYPLKKLPSGFQKQLQILRAHQQCMRVPLTLLLAKLSVVWLFSFSHSSGRIVVYNCDFSLQFPSS